METSLLSIIIPSRNEKYLIKTINDLLEKAEENIEIIVVFDGMWGEVDKITDKRVKMIYHGTVRDSKGMRESINTGVRLSSGEYIMKLDGHCMMDKGYDKKLKADCEDNWVVIPRRHRLDPDNWVIANGGKIAIDYMYIAYPLLSKVVGLHGAIWNSRSFERKDTVMIDDTPSMQGSCYFMKRKYWDELLGRLEDENYGPFAEEAQEIGFKTWLSGGRVVVNKNTWYAHLHKGSGFGKNYGFSNAQYRIHTANIEKGRRYCNDFWPNNRWDKRIHDFEWFIDEKFPDMPGWEKDWKEKLKNINSM